MKHWILPVVIALISTGFVVFTGYISISFVLDRYGGDPFWIVLSVIAIGIEVIGLVVLTELIKQKHFISAMFGTAFLALAVVTTVSFEIGKFAQASSDTVASRQYEADAFTENRKALSDLRNKRDAALKKGWSKSAAKYQASIDQLQKWSAGTSVREVDPRASFINRYTGLNGSVINDGMAVLIILFLLLGRTLTPYWAYCLSPFSVKDRVNSPDCSKTVQAKQQRISNLKEYSPKEAVEYFMNLNTQTVNGSRTGATDLYRNYTIYAALNDLPWLQQKDFGAVLGNLGLKKGRKPGNGIIAYLDIELLEAA